MKTVGLKFSSAIVLGVFVVSSLASANGVTFRCASPEKHPLIRVTATASENTVEFRVRDSRTKSDESMMGYLFLNGSPSCQRGFSTMDMNFSFEVSVDSSGIATGILDNSETNERTPLNCKRIY